MKQCLPKVVINIKQTMKVVTTDLFRQITRLFNFSWKYKTCFHGPFPWDLFSFHEPEVIDDNK